VPDHLESFPPCTYVTSSMFAPKSKSIEFQCA
jgi:hypothetical protein